VSLLRSSAIFPLLLIASCAGDGGGDGSAAGASSSETNGFKPFSERMADTMAGRDGGYTKDEDGSWTTSSKKRSSFETDRNSPYFKGDYAKKEYGGKKDYSKKSWWGATEYERKGYEGDTDGSRFQSTSRYQGKGARETGTAANLPGDYRTENYATGAANEAGQRHLDKPSDAETDVRRRVFPAPTVTRWNPQRAMSVEETKGILGR
jgi:hypothetical protein